MYRWFLQAGGQSVSRQIQGVLLAAFSAACFGLTPLFAKVAYAGGSNVLTLLFTRYAVTSALLWLVIAVRRTPARLSGAQFLRLSLLGIAGHLAFGACYYTSVRFVAPSLAALLLYTYPALVALWGLLFWREPLGGRSRLALTLALVGVALVVQASVAGFHPLGAGLALVSAVVYSLYMVAGGRMLSRIPPLVVTAWLCTVAAGAVGAAGLAAGMTWRLTPAGWAGAVLGMGVVGTVLAVTSFFGGMARIGAARAAIISTVEPLVTVATGVLLLGDQLAGVQVLGGALVLASGLLVGTERSGEPVQLVRAQHTGVE